MPKQRDKKPRYPSFGAITLNKQDQLMVDEFDAYQREHQAKLDDLVRRMRELAQKEGFPNVMICVADVPELEHAEPDFPSLAVTSHSVQSDDYNVLVQMGTHLYSSLSRQLKSLLDAQIIGPDLSPYTTSTNSFTGSAGQA